MTYVPRGWKSPLISEAQKKAGVEGKTYSDVVQEEHSKLPGISEFSKPIKTLSKPGRNTYYPLMHKNNGFPGSPKSAEEFLARVRHQMKIVMRRSKEAQKAPFPKKLVVVNCAKA